MKNITAFAIFLSTCFLGIKSYAQAVDTVNSQHVAYLQSQLKTNTATSRTVAKIIEAYKSNASQVAAYPSIREAQKRGRIDLLINQKNTALKKLLSDAQLRTILPSSELR